MTLKKQLNEAIKALKAEMKMKKMEEAVRHAEEKERISREYAEQLEALINCVTEAEETAVSYTHLTLPTNREV